MNTKNSSSLRARLHAATTADDVRAIYAESQTYTQATGKWHRRLRRLAVSKLNELTSKKAKPAPAAPVAAPVEDAAPVAEKKGKAKPAKAKTAKAKTVKAKKAVAAK